MKAKMFLLLSEILLPATLLFLLSVISTASPSSPANKPKDYIRASCKKTNHPDLCYKSLSPYANTIQSKPTKLVQTSISVSLSKTELETSHITNRSRHLNASKAADPQVVKAMSTCAYDFGEAVSSLQRLVAMVKGIESYKNTELKYVLDLGVDMTFKIARGSLEFCKYAWKDVAKGPVKADVCRCAVKLQKFYNAADDLAMNLKKTLS